MPVSGSSWEWTLAFGAGYRLDIERIVDKGKFVRCCETGLDERKIGEFLLDQIMDDTQPVRAFGMALAGVVFHVAVVFDDGEGWTSIVQPRRRAGKRLL